MRLVPRLVVLSLAATLVLGCGGNNSGNQQDAAADVMHQFDAQRDQGQVQDDAGPTCGTFTQPMGCGFELMSCNTVKSNSDECGGDLDCVDTNLYGTVCLKKCSCSAECGVNTVCLPSKSTDYTNASAAGTYIGSAKGHCYFSFCGLEGDTTSPVGNGNFFGPCNLGGEAYIKSGAVQTRPGTCFPIFNDSDEGYLEVGQCQEAGAKKRGESCSFDVNQCYEPATFETCAVGSICIGRQGDDSGTCAKLCNPHAEGFNPAITGDCAADGDVTHDQYCQDSSDYQWDCTEPTVAGDPPTYNSVPVRSYVGFCVDTQACDLFASASNCTNAQDPEGNPLPGCEPTSPLSSYGLCGKVGAVPLGGTCNNSLLCEDKLVCITSGGSSTGACEKYCGLGVNAGKWPCDTNQICESILYGSDPGAGCWNDPWSLAFGICKPDTRQDGGT